MVRKLMFLVFLISITSTYADSNGIWTYPRDIAPGVFGADESSNPSENYTFNNEIHFNQPGTFNHELITNSRFTANDVFYSTSNIGIGVVNPSERLEVSGNIESNQLIDYNDNSYLLNPNGVSNIYRVVADSYFSPGTSVYYLNPAGTSRVGVVNANTLQIGGVHTDTIYVNEGQSNSISSGMIIDSTITSSDLGTNSVSAVELAPNSVNSNHIIDNGVVSSDILDGGVRTQDILDGTITSADLGSNSVGSDEISNNAVGASEISNNAVGSGELASNSVNSNHIVDNSIVSGDIYDGTIMIDDLNVNNIDNTFATIAYVDSVASSGIPTGAIIPFYLGSCPTGWIEADGTSGTPDLRGAFVRGMNGVSNGRDVSRSLGSYQNDEFESHDHDLRSGNNGAGGIESGFITWANPIFNSYYDSSRQNTARVLSRGGSETRPKNIALLYCMKQ